MVMITEARFDQLKSGIATNLKNMHYLLTDRSKDGSSESTYMVQQVLKYLSPVKGWQDDFTLNSGQCTRFARHINHLYHCFNGDDVKHFGPVTWSYQGANDVASGLNKARLALTFGHSSIGRDGSSIRIQTKAGVLPDRVLSGVMVHEATHKILKTEDHVYDWLPFTHLQAQGLDPALKYRNADNWRIFYQKMAVYFQGRQENQD